MMEVAVAPAVAVCPWSPVVGVVGVGVSEWTEEGLRYVGYVGSSTIRSGSYSTGKFNVGTKYSLVSAKITSSKLYNR